MSRAQNVTNVQAAQVPGTSQVTVAFDLTGAPPGGALVTIAFSSTGGAPYSIVPASNALTGAVGPGVTNGTGKTITWTASETLPAGTHGTTYRAAVTATATQVTSFTSNPTTITAGQSSLLSWTSTGGTTASIDSGVGTVATNGSHLVLPAATTTYTLTVNGPAGQATAQATVVVNPAACTSQECTVTLPGGVPLVMARIPAGSFRMGSPVTELNRNGDETLHDVTISTDYYVGRYLVTQGQWKAVVGSNPSTFTSCGDTCPVENVSWNDIAGSGGFIDRLNAYLTTTGQPGAGAFRLPTEAEWERAARGGTQTRFSFGDALDGNDICGASSAASPYVWWCANSANVAHAVGTKGANPFGLFDVHGNVWEWCQDWYGPYPPSPQADPTGPPSGTTRALRGGAWDSPLYGERAAARGANSPSYRLNDLGFRVARSL